MIKYLHITLHNLQLRAFRQIEDNYFSIHWSNVFHFSSAFSFKMINSNFTITLNDHLILPYDCLEQLPSILQLQVWQNHMILFEHEIDVSQLKGKSTTKKKYQVRQGQILSFTVNVLDSKQLTFSKQYLSSISQHYLLIGEITLVEEEKEEIDVGPSYFMIQLEETKMIIPVLNSITIIQLPTIFQFYHIKNGKINSKSKKISAENFEDKFDSVEMSIGQIFKGTLNLKVQWGIDLSHRKFENSILLDAHEVLIYDIQIKFENNKIQLANSYKLKILYGNKSFELNGELDASKTIRYQRIIYFIIKSEQEEFLFVVEKNSKIIGKVVIGTDQIISYFLNSIKKKVVDITTGKPLVSIKFKCQKAKNLSIPQNNKFWKSCNSNTKKKNNQTIMIQISQISIHTQDYGNYTCLVKTQSEQIPILGLNNFSFFKLESEISQPVSFAIKSQANIYVKIVKEENRNKRDEYVGIAVINYNDLRLGINCLTLPFFKNKEKTCEINVMINKVMPWSFIKSTFQPEILTASSYKTIGLAIMIKRIELNEYYYTFQYENKTELYCIVEINRIKKVLILERFVSKLDKLLFINANGSDALNFIIDESQFVKVRCTILISDGGVQQQIYGYQQIKVRASQLKNQDSVQFKNIILANQYGIIVGETDFQILRKQAGDFKRVPIKKDLKNVKNEIDKVNKSIENVEKSIQIKKRVQSQNKYGLERQVRKRNNSITVDLKLPQIKGNQKQNDRLKNLARLLEMRKKERENRYERAQKLKKQAAHHTIDVYGLDSPGGDKHKKSDRTNASKSLVIQTQKVNVPSRELKEEWPINQDAQQHIEPYFLQGNERHSEVQIKGLQNQFEENEFANVEAKGEE